MKLPVSARAQNFVDERLNARIVIGVIVKCDVATRHNPLLELKEVPRNVCIIMKAVDKENMYRLVPPHFIGVLLNYLNVFGEVSRFDIAIEAFKCGRTGADSLIQRSDFPVVWIDRIDLRVG